MPTWTHREIDWIYLLTEIFSKTLHFPQNTLSDFHGEWQMVTWLNIDFKSIIQIGVRMSLTTSDTIIFVTECENGHLALSTVPQQDKHSVH